MDEALATHIAFVFGVSECYPVDRGQIFPVSGFGVGNRLDVGGPGRRGYPITGARMRGHDVVTRGGVRQAADLGFQSAEGLKRRQEGCHGTGFVAGT